MRQLLGIIIMLHFLYTSAPTYNCIAHLSLPHRTVGQLGSGQFANVEKAVWCRPHGIIEVAVKTLHSDASPTDKLKFLQEGAITSQFRHPNVIFLHGIITDKSKVGAQCDHIIKIGTTFTFHGRSPWSWSICQKET